MAMITHLLTCFNILFSGITIFAKEVEWNGNDFAQMSLAYTTREQNYSILRVRYTMVNLEPAAFARNFSRQLVMQDRPGEGDLCLQLFVLYNESAYVIVYGISTLMYRV